MTTPITLQIALPQDLELSGAELERITGRGTVRKQMEWLDENGWTYTLAAGKGVVVGKLYAHLRLAGLHPADLAKEPAGAGGFNLSATR